MSDVSIPPRSGDAILQLVHNPYIRRAEFENTTYYSLVDLMRVFAGSQNDVRVYWSQVKKRLKKEGADELYHHMIQLPLTAADGKRRLTDVGDIIAVKRIIMSIESPKAEPLKMYMAGKTDALLAYRAMNVRNGMEWAADEISENVMALLDDPGDMPFWWQE